MSRNPYGWVGPDGFPESFPTLYDELSNPTQESQVIEVGKKAPAFTLENQAGEKTKLSDYAGKWVVLYFYPKDDTPGCTTQACDFTAGIEDFAALEAEVIGVSPDGPEKHRKFINKHDLKLTLLCDPDHVVMEKYGAWGEKMMYGKKTVGVKRSTVLIDPKGKIVHHWPNVRAKGHADKVRELLNELRG